MFSAAVMCGQSAKFWNTMPMPRSFGGTSLIRCPSKRISPSSGVKKPAISRSSVLLPQPDGPRRVNNSPSWIDSVTWLTAARAAKRLVTLSTSMRIEKEPPAEKEVQYFFFRSSQADSMSLRYCELTCS